MLNNNKPIAGVPEDGKPDSKPESGSKPKRLYDRYTWGIYIVLCLVSIVELYSASSREITMSSSSVYAPIIRHLFMLGLGFVFVLAIQYIHYHWFVRFGWVYVAVSVALAIYVLFCGDYINGARRSFTLMGVMVQPAEMLKLAVVFAIANTTVYFKKRGKENLGVATCAAFILLFCGLLFEQGLTNTLLLATISFCVFFVSGVKFSKFCIVVLVFAFLGGAVVSYKVIGSEEESGRTGTWEARLERYFDTVPKYERPLTAENRQEMYSYMAQANGGLFGVRPGNSRETARLPLANIDYIYAIVIEDWGFILGGLALLALYLMLLSRALTIAMRCTDAYSVTLVLGASIYIVFQALFHMAIVTGVFPVSGQPLPLISKGGTSIVVTSIALGVMLSISMHAPHSKRLEKIKAGQIAALSEEEQDNNSTKE